MVVGGTTIIGSEGHAAEVGAFETDGTGRDQQFDPLTGGGEKAHVTEGGGSILAVGNVVSAPVGTMFPGGAVIPMEHDLRRQVGRIEVNPGEDGITRGEGQLRGGGIERVVVLTGRDGGLVRNRTGVGRRTVVDPIPGVAAGSG